jgi:uncharacterized protein YwbE
MTKPLPVNKFRHEIKNHVKEYTYKDIIIVVNPLSSGGFSLNVSKINNISSKIYFDKLVNNIIDRYPYQYLIFNIRTLDKEYINILHKIGFVETNRGLVYQEKPKIGHWALIAIKPYTGDYAQGYVKNVLTNKGFHPRGFKLKLNDEKETVGRVAVIV